MITGTIVPRSTTNSTTIYISTPSVHANNTNNILNSITAAADTAANTGNTANSTKQLRVVKLRGVSTRSIGVVLARVSLPELKCHGYQVITIMPEGLAKR